MIKSVSSHNKLTDLFDIAIYPISGDDNEYIRDFEIDHVNSINWNKILEENNVEVNYFKHHNYDYSI